MTESEKLSCMYSFVTKHSLHFLNIFLWMLNHNFELCNIFVFSDCFKSG